jgi:hypothetical protein
VPSESACAITSSHSLRTLVQGLFLLLAETVMQKSTEDTRALLDLLERVKTCENEKQLDNMMIEEEYNALFVDSDNAQAIRESIILQALLEAVENSAAASRHLLLQEYVQVISRFLKHATQLTLGHRHIGEYLRLKSFRSLL